MLIIDRILYIPEIEAIVFSNLDPIVDFKALALVNHYYYQIINQNELYTELKKFCYNRQAEVNWLYGHHWVFIGKIHTEFLRACYFNKLWIAKYIYSTHNVDLHIQNDIIFQLCCYSRHLEVVQWLFELDHKIDIHMNNERPFRWACGKGHLEVARWLFEVDHKIDIHAEDESAFGEACKNGHLEVAKWLFELDHKIDIHVCYEWPFRWACANGHLEVARWLFEVDHKIDIHANNEKIFRSNNPKIIEWLTTL
jgi:hypothetical protein